MNAPAGRPDERKVCGTEKNSWRQERMADIVKSWKSYTQITHLHGSARVECCKGDDQSQWRRVNFDRPPILNPWTDLPLNLHRWLRRGYLPPCKILFRSNKAFRFHACAIRAPLFTWLSFFGGSKKHLQPRRHHGRQGKIRPTASGF